MSQWLDQWQAVGARRLMDFRELAAVVGRRLLVEERDGKLLLTVERESAPALVRPLAVFLRVPGGQLPSHVRFGSMAEISRCRSIRSVMVLAA